MGPVSFVDTIYNELLIAVKGRVAHRWFTRMPAALTDVRRRPSRGASGRPGTNQPRREPGRRPARPSVGAAQGERTLGQPLGVCRIMPCQVFADRVLLGVARGRKLTAVVKNDA